MAEGRRDAKGSPPTHPNAEQDAEGRWCDANGTPLPVSASDLERYTYCPMSWHLATKGVSGQSAAIEKGKERHQAIHESMMNLKGHQFEAKRNLLIWQWWYAIIVVLLIDTVAIQYIDDLKLNVMEFSKILAAGALSFLVVGILALLVPWRKTIGLKEPFLPDLEGEVETIDPVFEPRGFMGGWFQGGLLEAYMFVSAILLAIHSSALLFAENRQQASYVLAITTLSWTLLASIILRRALKNNDEAQRIAVENNLKVTDEISYSDDEEKPNCWWMKPLVSVAVPTKLSSLIRSSFPLSKRRAKSPNDLMIHIGCRPWPTPVWWRLRPAEHHRMRSSGTATTICISCHGMTLRNMNSTSKSQPCKRPWP